jgi:uncharacterized protein (TIGR03435 family)
MKKFLLLLFALAGASASAQDITGTWQGTLSVGRDLRVVVKFSKDGASAWKGDFYSIDQSGQAFGLTKIVARDGAVSFNLPQAGAEYAGKLSSDGGTINGTWTQGPTPIALVLSRVTPAGAWNIPEPPAKLPPMAADAKPTFEVATIKPTKPDQAGKYIKLPGRHFSSFNTSLVDLLSFAYGVHEKQILKLPAWAYSDKFDLAGEPDAPGLPNDKQWKAMLQKLLTERFQLTIHHGKKELSVYAITVAKGGPRLTRSASDPSTGNSNFFTALGDMVNINSSMVDFAGALQATVFDRPVIDRTGLTGKFDFKLKWTPDESQFAGAGVKVPPPSDKADAPPSLYTAIQEQLGLKLDPVKAPVDVLVVDHVEKPSEN